MSRKEKLISRFKKKPTDFTFDELVTLLGYYGYYIDNKGKTSGSRVKFVNIFGYKPIICHKPHNRKCLLKYQLEDVEKDLNSEGIYL